MNSNGNDATNTGHYIDEEGELIVNPFVTVPQAFMAAFGAALEKDILSEMASGAELGPLTECNNTINFGDDDEQN